MKKTLIKEAQNTPFYLEDGEDMSVTKVVVRETPDCYYDFEAILGNGWYSLNGAYNGVVIYDNFIMGNGGHGQQIPLKPQVLNWLDINVTPQLEQKINSKINSGSVERFEAVEADNVFS